MRLTLRNLLRFLDRPDLNPLERAELQERVHGSERAQQWIERIHRLRSDAGRPVPALEASPSPAQVARYLGGQMNEGESVEFEKSALAHDLCLGEVAAVNWMICQARESDLAVGLELRQRLYDLDRANASRVAEGMEDTGNDLDDTLIEANGDLPFVDSTEETGRDADASPGRFPGAALWETGPAAPGRRMAAVLLGAAALLGAAGVIFWISTRDDRPAVTDIENNPGPENPVDAADSDKSENPNNPDAGAGTDDDRADADHEKGSDPPDADPPTGTKTGIDPGAALVTVPLPPPPAEPEPSDSLPPRPELYWLEAAAGGIAENNPPPDEDEQPKQVVLTSLAFQPCVLVKNAPDEDWQTPSRESLVLEGGEVLVLSGAEASFQIGAPAEAAPEEESPATPAVPDLLLTVTGPARVKIGQFDVASGTHVFDLQQGRVRINSRNPDTDVLVDVQGVRYRVTLEENASGFEAGIHHYLMPGDDLQSSTPTVVRSIRQLQGRVSVQGDAGSWNLDERMAVASTQSPNDLWNHGEISGIWKVTEGEEEYLKRMRDDVARESREWMAGQTPVYGDLMSMKNSNRQEIRLLAAVWLCELGRFDFVVDFLGSEDNRAAWGEYLAALRANLHASPAHAASLQQALAKNPEGELWYRMIRGYSPQEVEAGGDAELVAALTSASLVTRVLAIDNLRMITGGTTYGYSPHQTRATRNRVARQQWEPEVAKKKIRYETAPAPRLPEFESVTPPASSSADDPDADN